ncbi:MAG: hypothetical protein IJV37_00685 [Bacteroidales bacterium]|nr:hypothetical protein [Bacteroidales bacterium]
MPPLNVSQEPPSSRRAAPDPASLRVTILMAPTALEQVVDRLHRGGADQQRVQDRHHPGGLVQGQGHARPADGHFFQGFSALPSRLCGERKDGKQGCQSRGDPSLHKRPQRNKKQSYRG